MLHSLKHLALIAMILRPGTKSPAPFPARRTLPPRPTFRR
jgi:hypothetical protein